MPRVAMAAAQLSRTCGKLPPTRCPPATPHFLWPCNKPTPVLGCHYIVTRYHCIKSNIVICHILYEIEVYHCISMYILQNKHDKQKSPSISGLSMFYLADIQTHLHKNFIWFICGCLLKWWYPKNTPRWSFLVGKPMVVGYQHFRTPPCVWGCFMI